MDCPKCNRPMDLDIRASDKKQEIWNCLWLNCRHTVRLSLLSKDEQIDQLQAQVKHLKAENEKLTKRLMEHGEALIILSQLRRLYCLSRDMKEPQVESAAKQMIKQAADGLRLAHNRRQEEYIDQLQAEVKRLNDLLKYATDTLKAQTQIAEQIEQALKGK